MTRAFSTILFLLLSLIPFPLFDDCDRPDSGHVSALFSIEKAFAPDNSRITRIISDRDLAVYAVSFEKDGFTLKGSELRIAIFNETMKTCVYGRQPKRLPDFPPVAFDMDEVKTIVDHRFGLADSDPRRIKGVLEESGGIVTPYYDISILKQIGNARQLIRGRIDPYQGDFTPADESTPILSHRFDGIGSVYKFSPFDGPLVNETLAHMESMSDLYGENVIVLNDDPRKPVATGLSGSFVYPPNDERIEMVMLYYYIDKIFNWYRTTFQFIPKQQTIMVYSNVTQYKDRIVENNAAYLGVFDVPQFGGAFPIIIFSEASPPFKSVMLSADIIMHEFNHFVIDSITKMGDEVTQNGLHEGLSDYFAATLTNDPKIGEYFVQGSERQFLRNLAGTDRRYSNPMPYEYLDPHVFGEMISQTAWDFRNLMLRVIPGATPSEVIFIVDNLIYRALSFFSSATVDPRDLFRALIDLDKNLYDGLHLAIILRVFYNRGFTLPSFESSAPLNRDPVEAQPMPAAVGAEIPISGTTPLSGTFITIAYYWQLIERPNGSNAVISQSLDQNIRFIPDLPGEYVLQYHEAYDFFGLGPPVNVRIIASYNGPVTPSNFVPNFDTENSSAGGCGLVRKPEPFSP